MIDYWVCPKELNRGTNQSYQRSEEAEGFVAKLLTDVLSLDYDTLHITRGKNSDFDLTLNDYSGTEFSFEVKFTSGDDVWIEYAYADGRQSGILISKSKFYVIVNHQQARIDERWIDVGKIRVYDTKELRKWVLRSLADGKHEIKPYKEAVGSPGSLNVKLKPKMHEGEIPHIWIGDVECQIRNRNDVYYNLENLMSYIKDTIDFQIMRTDSKLKVRY